jgi:prepilin-type N-terminal cleavage/methylation domain-containing protein
LFLRTSSFNLLKGRAGFTLLELLVVIAILGVLAVIVFVAIDPTEKQAQARDTGRVSSVVQLGRAVEAYLTSRGTYPDEASWAQDLLDTGEVGSFPSGIAYTAYSVSNCTTFVQPAGEPTYCYEVDTAGSNGAIVFARAEADSDNSKCTSPEVAYFVFSTADGRGGTICSNGDPSPWTSGSQSYVD